MQKLVRIPIRTWNRVHCHTWSCASYWIAFSKNNSCLAQNEDRNLEEMIRFVDPYFVMVSSIVLIGFKDDPPFVLHEHCFVPNQNECVTFFLLTYISHPWFALLKSFRVRNPFSHRSMAQKISTIMRIPFYSHQGVVRPSRVSGCPFLLQCFFGAVVFSLVDHRGESDAKDSHQH